MPVPKKKLSKSKKRQRRSHHALRAPGLSTCAKCGAVCLPHRVCGSCGHYRGRQIVQVEKEEDL
jgi:large subunit ribosomal protein L32